MILVDQNHKATVLRMIQVGSLLDKTMLVLRPLMPVLQGLQKNGNNGAGAVEPQK